MNPKNRTLSKNESKVILGLSWNEQKTVTVDDLRAFVDGSESYLYHLIHRLVQKGWLERLKPGLFQLVPADRGIDGIPDVNQFIDTASLVKGGGFYSFGSACEYYGFTDQHFMDMYLVSRDKKRPLVIREKKYFFAFVPEKKYFSFHKKKIYNCYVEIATPERTIVDSIDRPRYAGGIGEVSKIVRRASTKISWESLNNILEEWRESAVVQRLGFLIDLNQINIPSYAEKKMLSLINPTNKIHIGSRIKWGSHGNLNSKWGIIINVPIEVLLGNHKLSNTDSGGKHHDR